MKEQNDMGCEIKAELYRGGKLIPDEKVHKFAIIRRHEIVKIELKKDAQNET